MSDTDRIVTLAERWMSYARQDLQAAKTLMNEDSGFTQQICFLSQQTAEKAIKAGLIFLQIEFPFVHNLDHLRDL